MGSLLAGAFLLIAGCNSSAGTVEDERGETGRIQVVATLFPQYDFARQIGGEKVAATKMINPGVDAHTYEPTPQDIIALNQADLFIYTGAEMEPWAETILESIDAELNVLDASIGVDLIPWGETSDEASHDHSHDEDDHHEHNHRYDPHIWTSPVNAMAMANNVLEALIAISPEDEDYFRANAEALRLELEVLDGEFREMMANAKRLTIVHAGRFAMHYLMYEYGIAFVASPNETDPSAALVAKMIALVNEEGIPVIFHEELVDPQLANMIASETDAKVLELHTVHNVSQADFERGVTYVELMQRNLEHLKIALN